MSKVICFCVSHTYSGAEIILGLTKNYLEPLNVCIIPITQLTIPHTHLTEILRPKKIKIYNGFVVRLNPLFQ